MPAKCATYLMPPEMHVQLSFVRGFNTMNGDRYQDYIVMCLENILTSEQKTKVLETRRAEEALTLLGEFDIEFTHEWEE